MADPSEFEYHGDQCQFCQSMILDPGRTRSPLDNEPADGMIFLGPTLASVLAATAACPLAQALFDDWEAGYPTSAEMLRFRRHNQTASISLACGSLKNAAQSIHEMRIMLWDAKYRRGTPSLIFHVLTTDGE